MTDPRELIDTYASETDFYRGDLLDDREHEAPKAFAALRAVLDLHKPIEIEHGWDQTVDIKCNDCCDLYPCQTVQAITTALGATDG
ncbi:hypothetical protein [Amycolatopsis benzoatilytica]|uniref:hypothetical protein n=1 Tax=Amycolatopsis benzoatilytica TaxID=346045 RepID=UPI00036CAD05|nr:hypothetical protein [Amycolatopsis benzoatilytica]